MLLTQFSFKNIYKNLMKYINIGISTINDLRGDYAESIKSLEKNLNFKPDDPETHWRLGITFLKSSNILEAIKHLQFAVEKGNGQTKYLFWLSTAENLVGNTGKSFELIKEVIDKQPDKSDAWALQGSILKKNGQIDEAILCFKKALELNPNDIISCNDLGCIYMEKNSPIKALETFTKGLKVNKKEPALLFNLGLVYLKLDKYFNSIEFLEKAKKNKFNTPELYNALGYCYSRIDNLTKAEDNYQKSLELFPNNTESICNLAAIKGKKLLYDDAIKLYEKLIANNKCDATILNNIAWCLDKKNLFEDAIKYYYRALAMEPENVMFRLNLSECLYNRGYLTEAISHLEGITKKNSSNQKAWEILGRIYDRCKLHAKAIDCYNKALGLE